MRPAHDLWLLSEGVRLFNAGEHYESHRYWEDLWLRNDSELRPLLQALIQLAGAHHLRRRGPQVGAEALLREAQARLAACPDELCGIDVAALREDSIRIAYTPPSLKAFEPHAGSRPGPRRKTDWL